MSSPSRTLLLVYCNLLNQERGATAVEYAIIVSLIAGVIIVSVGALGGSTTGAFADVVDNWNDAQPS